MRKLLALILCAAVLPLSAVAEDAKSVKKQIEANHDKAMAGFAKGDLKPMMAMCADDYVGIGPGGMKMNKAQMEAQMKVYVAGTKKVHSSSYKVSGLKVKGNTASGKSTFTLDADVDGEMMGNKGKTHRMHMVDVYNTTWVKRGGKWLVQKESPVSSKMKIDGKDFNPGAPPNP